MIDAHTHLENGPLNKEYILEFINAAKASGMKTLHILDHTHRFKEYRAMYEPLIEANQYQKDFFANKGKESIAKYHAVIDEMKKMNFDLEVKFGLEVCYSEEAEGFIKDQLQAYPYDFVVGSIHSIDNKLYDMQAFSKAILWDIENVDTIYQMYYDTLLNLIKSGLFTQVGHPDQIKLFQKFPTYDLIPTYETIAHQSLMYGVSVESNTGIHYRYLHPDIGTNLQLLKALRKAGVPIVTASDAHKSKDVGRFIIEARKSIDEVCI